MPLYWNDFYTIESADEMDQNESLRFFDWFFFDYQHEDEPRLIQTVRGARARPFHVGALQSRPLPIGREEGDA